MKPNIELHIEELVLHGFEGYNRFQIKDAVAHEIMQLLKERSLPAVFSVDSTVVRVNAGNFTMSPKAKAATVGRNIAKSVFNGLNRDKSNTSKGGK